DVQKLLGKGATGTVYLARDTFTGREVALKTIEPEVFRDPEFGTVYRSQFLQEASLAGKLRHPHIVAILDAVVAEDSGHIAMEYLTGGDLSKHAAPENLLPVADVLQIGFKCDGKSTRRCCTRSGRAPRSAARAGPSSPRSSRSSAGRCCRPAPFPTARSTSP